MRPIIVGLVLWEILVLSAMGATYLVRPDGTGDFPTIQAAIDGVVGGDTIELANGVFQGDGNWDVRWIGKQVTLRSRSGDPRVCLLYGGGVFGMSHWGIYIENVGAEAALEGVTVVDALRGGIRMLDSSLRIERCVLANNESAEGGGLLVNGASSPTIVGCTFLGNSAIDGGGLCI